MKVDVQCSRKTTPCSFVVLSFTAKFVKEMVDDNVETFTIVASVEETGESGSDIYLWNKKRLCQ